MGRRESVRAARNLGRGERQSRTRGARRRRARTLRSQRGGRGEQRPDRGVGSGQDRAASSKACRRTSFTVTENEVPQKLDIVRQEAVGATFALMVDSSSSMSRRMDFVQRTAATLSGYLSPIDRMIVAPFSLGVGGGDRTDQRPHDDPAGDRSDPPGRRNGDPRLARAGGKGPGQRRRPPGHRADHRRVRRAQRRHLRRRARRGAIGRRHGVCGGDWRRRRHFASKGKGSCGGWPSRPAVGSSFPLATSSWPSCTTLSPRTSRIAT